MSAQHSVVWCLMWILFPPVKLYTTSLLDMCSYLALVYFFFFCKAPQEQEISLKVNFIIYWFLVYRNAAAGMKQATINQGVRQQWETLGVLISRSGTRGCQTRATHGPGHIGSVWTIIKSYNYIRNVPQAGTSRGDAPMTRQDKTTEERTQKN